MNSFSTSHSHPPKHITDHNRLALLSVFLRRTKVARSLPATLSTWILVCLLLTVHCLLPTGLSAQQTQPVLDWSTYFDGSTRNDALKYVVDDDGSIWFGHLVGQSGGGTPTTPDAFEPNFNPNPDYNAYDSYVGKLSPDGQFEYGSYFPTNRGDFNIRMGQDENYVYVLNYIWSRATTHNIFTHKTGNHYGLADRGGADNDQGFYSLVKIDKATNTPVLVTELPGTEYLFTNASGVGRSGPSAGGPFDIVTKDGYAYFAGRSVRRPRTGLNESWAYIIAPDHTGTLIRLNRRDAVDHAVRVGDYIAADNGDFILYGAARGNGALGDASFQTTDNTVFTDPIGNWDMYLRRYDQAGNLIFSTLLGGTGTEFTYDAGSAFVTKVLEMPDGTVLVSGETESADFPYSDGTVDANSTTDVFLAAYAPDGTHLWTRGFVSDAIDNTLFNMEVHPDGQQLIIHTMGNGDSGNNLTITPGAAQPNYGGGTTDQYIAFLDPATGNINYGTWYGGTGNDRPRYGAGDDDVLVYGGDILFSGLSLNSTDYPVTPGATDRGDYGTFLVLNSVGALEMATTTNIVTEKPYMDDEVIYALGVYDPATPEYSTVNAFQPSSNSGGNNSQAVIVKIRRCDGKVAYQTFLGGQYQQITGQGGSYTFPNRKFQGTSQPDFIDGKLYVGGDYSSLVQPHPTTEGAFQTSGNGSSGLVFFSFDMEKEVTWGENALVPSSQLTCTNGIAEPIDGSRVVIDPEHLPDIIRGGQESYPEQKAVYQWQIASSAGGPWTDINGALQEDYQHNDIGNQDIFLRRLAFNPNECDCNDTLSVSNIHQIQVSNDEAPTAEAGDPARICPGETWPLGGGPSATGGTTPYTYSWEPANALTSEADTSIANPTAMPATSTIYTLEVLDANGCRALDQVTVTPWTYTAGEDKTICFGESGVRIGSPRPAGASEATYSWSVVSGTAGSLSCTDCPQPIASPMDNTVYEVDVTFPSDNGTTCMFTDQVTVSIASYPGANFAGPDMATCLNNPKSINGNYDVITLGNPSLPTGPGYTYQWSPLNSFIDGSQQNQPTIEFSNGIFIPSTIPQTYTLTMTTPEGCVYQDQVQVYPLESDLGDDRCAPKVVGDNYNPDIYDGNALYTYNIIAGGGSLDVDNDCVGDDVGGSVSGMDMTWVRVLDDPNGMPGEFTDVEQVVNYDGFICRDTVRIFICGPGNCIFDIEAEGGNCPVVGPDGTLTLVPVRETGAPWPNNGDWTFEWTDAADSILTTDYELNVTDPAQAWYYLKITSTVPVGGNNPCYPDREPRYTMCVDSILVNQPGFARPMIDFPDTTICFGDEVEIGAPGGGFDYEWTDSTGTFESTAPNPMVSPETDATYYVTVTDPITECFTMDTVRVKVLTVPVDAGPDRYICNNAVIQIGADTAQAGLLYQWEPEAAPWRMPPPNTMDADPDGDTKAQPWVLVAADLEFILTVTDTITGCVVRDTVNVYTANSPQVFMSESETICAGESLAIGPMEENPDYLYEWTPATGLSCTDCFSPQASPEMTTNYQLRVRFADPSCPNDTTLNVEVTVNESDITMGPDMNFCPSSASLQIQGAPAMTDQGNAITSYMWAPTTNMNDPTLQTPTVNPPPNSETTYTVTTTDANGCMAGGSVTYTPEAIANSGPGRTLCLGETAPIGSPDNIGSISWTGVGGAPIGALNNPTIAQPTFDSEVSGVGTFQYQVSVTNNGCTTTDMVTVTVQGFDPPEMDPLVLCRNSCGNIGFENNNPDLEFFWSPTTGLSDPNSSMTQVCVDSVDRFYELTIRNTVTGCVSQATVSVTVQETEAPQVDIPDVNACFGQQVVLEPNIIPDTGDLTYDWSPTLGLSNPFVRNPILNTEALGLGIHTFELTVVDEHGCINIASVQIYISENGCCTPPVINTIVKDASCGTMDGAVTIVLPENPDAYNIMWSPMSGMISADSTQLENISTGTYQVTVVDTAVADIEACAAEELLIVGTHQEELVVNEVVNEPANCNEGTGGMVQLSPSYYTYAWSDGGTGYIRNDLDAGCYVVEVTVPGSECTDIMEVCVEEAGTLEFTGVIEKPQCETSDGSITILPSGGTGPYNAQWSDGQIGLERENLMSGVYTVTVTDATGCSGDSTFILSNDVAATGNLTISTVDPECAGEATGSITFGGSCTGCIEPVSVRLLNNGGATIAESSPVTGLKPGNYTVLMEDANGCLVEGEEVILNDPPTMHLDIDQLSTANCNGEYGSIYINVRGGTPEYSYLWGPDGQTTQNLIGVDTGNYTIQVTDANGCMLASDQQLAADSMCCPQIGIQSSVVVDDECGSPGGTGTAAVVPTGSPSGYTFAWYDSDSTLVTTDSLVTGLEPGAYRVIVRADVPACTDSIEYVLTVGTLQGPQIVINSITDATCLDSDGSVSVSVVEGPEPFTYLWNTGETTPELINVPAGTYWVVVTDSTGCSETEVVTIGQTSGDLALSLTGTDAICNLTNGSASISVTGGTSPYTYQWSNGLSTQTINNLPAGIYSVTVTDANGCMQTGEVAISNTGGPELTVEVATDVLCIGDASGVVNLSSSDPNAILELRDDQGMIVGVGNTVENLWAGTYTVVARAADGCETYEAVTIVQPAEVLDLEISKIIPATCEDELGRLDIDVMGGTGPYTYEWSNGATTEDLEDIASGSYYVVVTDANGCTVEEGYELGQDINCNTELAFRKEHIELTYTGNPNEFLLEYYLIAENPDSLPGYYSLYDSIAFADGVTVVSTPSVNYIGGDGLMGMINAGFDGVGDQLVMSNDTIGPGTSDTFLISMTLNMDFNIITAESGDCDPLNNTGNTGLTNVGALTSPDSTIRDTVCTPIPVPGVEMTKSIVSDPVPTGVPNEYTMSYVITVEDTTGYRAYYDLSDTLQYGSGANFVSGVVTYGGTDGLQTSIITSSPTDTAYQITDDEWVDSLRTDSFYVEVVFMVDPNTLTAASADCDYTNDGGANSGLTNVAVINDAVPLDRDTVCAPIPLPGVELTKTVLTGPAPTGNVNEYTMTYVITVEDTTGYRAYYDLSDTIQFAYGVNFVNAAVSYGGTDGLQTGIVTPAPTDSVYQIVDDEWVDSLETDSFYVEVLFTINPNILTHERADCDYTNDMDEYSGLTNVAVIGDGVPMDRDTACAQVPRPAVVMTKSIVSEPVPTGNVNEYTMTYVITVEDTTGYRAYYDLSDTIQYGSGATFVSGTVTYGGTDGLNTSIITPAPTDTAYQITDDEWIDSLRTDSFYVEVVFTIDPDSLTAESADCDYTNDGGANSGLTNVAVINDAVPLDRDTVCAPIPLPGVEMTKSIVSDPVPTGNVNEYTMTYVITVEDTTGYRAYYDLSDTIQYGAGATFVGGTVTYGGTDGLGTSIITPAPTDTAYQITDDEWIDSLRTDSFYVEVVFTIDPATLTAASADCDYTNDGGANSGLTNVAVINDAVPLDRDTVCAPIPLPGVEMTKSIVSDPVPTGNVNEYTMTYVISVEDTTGYRAYYDLSDTIQYGSGATFVSGTVTYGGTDGLNTSIITPAPTDTAYQIADDEWIDSLRTDSFYVEVVFTIDPATLTAASADCNYTNDGGSNSGLTNVAVINDAVPLDRDTVCAPIPLPGVEMTKSIVSDPVPTGNVNEYTMTYVISVEDTTGYRAYYDLSDTIQYGAGATFVSGAVTYDGTDGLNTSIITPAPTDTAYQITDDEWIDSLRTDSFYVEVVFTIDPATLTAESADCDYTNDGGSNSGLTNVAVINDAVPLDRDTVCAPIPLPGVEMTKSIVSDPVPTGNVNEYTMTYVISVEDTTGYRAYYDLSDTLQYGSGATFVSGTVTYGGTDGLQTSIIESTPTDTAYQIADNEWIDSLRTDSFYVEVVFTIDPATLTAASADCDYTNDGGSNSGLTNVAVINDAVPLDRDTVCAPIPLPGVEMTKSIVSDPVPTGNVNEYTMTYVISVEDTTGYRAYYDLSDTLQYGSGATFVSGMVTYGGTDGLNTSIITPAPTDTAYQITDDEWIDSLRTDSFYVEVVFTIDPATLTAASADCDYTNDGGANSGLTNVAVINDAVPLDRDTVCAPIPLPGVEMTKSIVSDPVPTGNVNEYTMTYVITVEDTTGYRAYYDLSDTIQYGSGATFVSGMVTYGGSDGLQTGIVEANPTDTAYQIADDEWIDSLGTDSFYVAVVFTIDPATLTAESADCDYSNDGGSNSGLTNVAVINDAVPLDRDTVCAPIPLPGVEMTKSIVSDPVPTGNVNEYTMTYVISVEDTTGYRAYYDLSDTIQYGSGATFVSGMVTYGGSDGLQTGIVEANPTDTAYQITDDEWIDSLRTDSFYVEVVFTIDPATLTAESADCDYTNDGGSNSGLTNVAVINDAVPLDRDTVCAPIPLPGVEMTKSIVSDPVPTGNVNEYTMTYVITVEDTTGYRAYYDLSDTIQYGAGATFVGGTVTYGGTDGLNTGIITPAPTDTAYQITDHEWIDSLGTDSFYVAVVFTIDPDSLTAESADCDYTNDGGANSGLTNVAVINDAVPLDRDTVCAPIPLPGVEMTKSIVSDPVPTGNVNEYTMTYVIAVEDTTGYRAYYDLSDTIQYGSGATFVSGTVTYGGTDGLQTSIIESTPTDTAYQIVDDEWVDSLEVDSFYVEVVFTIDPNTLTAESADCDYTNDGDNNSGLTNVAVINDAVPLDRDTVCAPIPLPGVEMTKSIVSDPVPTGNVNEYTMTYVITVEDTTGYRAYYDLSDTLQYGSGVTFVSGVVTYGGSDGLQTGIVEATPTDTAYQIADDEWIGSLRTDSFYVEVVFTIDPDSLTAESADCDYTNDGGANSGLTNVAVINDAVPLDRDTVCAPIPLPGVEMTKSIVSDPVPTGNVNEYTMTYVIAVEDTTGYRAYYDLSDTLQYGRGATFVSGVVTYGGSDGLQTGIVEATPTDTAYQIADDEWIDSLRTDSFYVEVVFTIDPATLTAASADCDYTNDGGANSGLTNVAVINDAVPLDRDTVCAPIPLPGVEMTKSIVSDPVPTGNVNEYTMTYVIAVEDTTGYRAYYDLSDTIKYGSGADFTSAVVTYGGADGLETSLITPNPTDTAYQIVDDETIENYGIDSFYVEVTFTIDPVVATPESADCDYSNDGGNNSGLTNVAVINDAVPLDRDTVCAPIPLPGVEMTKNIVSEPVPTGNVNEYTMTYVITVEDTTGYRAYYDLSDTIQYGAGANFVSGMVTYGGSDGLQTGIVEANPTDTAYQITDDEWIDSLRTDSFYVEVVFTIDPATLTAASADCDYTNDGGSNSGLTNVAVINDAVPLDRDTVCAPIPLPGVEMTKSMMSEPVPTGNVNEYTMTYVITVEDTTGYRAYYDLSDTIQYGAGANFVSGMVTYGGGDGLQTGIVEVNPSDTAYQITDDEWIDSLRTDSFYVEVVFTIDPATLTVSSADCDYTNDGGANSGLTNVAVINDAVPLDRDTVCAPIPLPGVEMTKSIVSEPVPTGNVNEYTMTYVITVEDTTGYRAYYNLSDTIQYGSGATFVSGTVTYGGTDGLQTSIIESTPTDTAYQIVDDEWVDSLEVDSFYVEVVFTIDPDSLTAESADCDYSNDGGANSGLTNVAVINDAVPLDRDTTCTEIPVPGVLLTKNVLQGQTPTGNVNEFSIIYTIAVEDTTGYRAFYDLVDTLKYGAGADFVSASVTYGGADGLQTSIVTSNPADTAYQIVEDEYVEDFDVDSFYVEVIFTIDPDVLTQESADCNYENNEGQSGLTNVATLNGASPAQQDSTCAQIYLPGAELVKTIESGPTPTGNPLEYTMRYAISVRDTMGIPVFYDLSDTLQYGDGADMVSMAVSYGGNNGLQTEILDSMPSTIDYQIVMDEMVDNFEMDIYYIDVVFKTNPETFTPASADCDPTNDNGGFSGLRNVAVIDNAIPIQRDTACAEIPPPCTPVNCYGSVNLSFGANCEIEVTADLLLIQNGLARAFPDQYTVELTYGDGIVIPDNILRPEHVGREIRAKVTSLLEECGGGMCESVIVLDKPSGCIIENTLDTLVYCIDPFLELSPEDAAYPKPEASRPCSSGSVSLESGPEWIDTDFACDSDTAEVIYREWYAETAGGESCSAYDTIVVLKLPALTGNEFTSLLEDTLNCELHSTLYEGEPEVEYHAWKQPLGLHNYEQANSGLQGVVYNLPQSILEVAYTQAEEEDVLEKYLDEVVLRKVNGAEYTVGDFVTGEGYEEYLDGLSNAQLSILEDQYQIGDEIVLILELGDWILSSDGYFEQVTKEWLYSGTGNQPYWFAGGWPFILSQENCITYKDSVIIPDENCLGTLQLPAITEVDGELVLNPDSCITLCISEGVHCGISVDSKGYGSWDGNCPSQRSRTVRIHQTCYTGAEGCDAGIYQDGENENSAVVSVDSTDKGIVIELEQWQSVLDTLGPLVDFCYNTEWDQDSIKKSLTIGEIPVKADEYEQNHVTVYNTTSHACSAEIFVPSISVRDVCSGIHHVKATLNGQSVLLETGEPNAEGYLTYVHKEGPIELAFRGAEIAPDQVKYEIVDSCWNSSRWHKYVKVKDNRAPEVVVNDTLRVGLSEKITWIPAESLNEGSWDNCGIELELVRRMDWSEGLIDCESAGEYLGWPDILERLGFDRSEVNEIFEGGVFDGDYALDLTNLESILVDSELGKHYFKSIVWLWEDSNCGEKVVHGWLYELALALSDDCQLADDHDTESSGLKEAELQVFFDGLTGIPGYGREIDLLGGGWSKDVPVGCEDACQSTDVEYLAMDHWCNWSKGWLPVEVEDKSGGKVTKVLEDLSLTCESYNMNYESVVEAALDAGNSNNNPEVFANLDSIWGGYIPTWVDNQGRPVHSDGVLFTEEEQTFNYSNITCDEKSEIIKIADTLHDGSIDWIEKVVKTTYLDEKINTGRHGVVGILCSGEVEQDIWVELDDCNQGVITRRFRIQSCSEKGAVIELEQKIYIESACSIRPSMFDLPEEETKVCVPRLEYDGSGNVLLPGAGKVVLKNSLHGVLCNNLAIGYRDKVYKLPGQSNSYVVDRKWEIADWCTSDNFTWMQKVAVEVDPECEKSSENNTFEVSGEVFTRDYSTIPKVHISVKSGETVLKSMETNETGYSMKLEEDSQVRIIPSKNDGHKAGLNTADIMAMMRHITGVAQLTTEYDRIAADVDNSGRIDIRDVLELRKLILTPGGKFPNSNSWRFLDMERYRPVYNIKSLSSPMEIDFMGIKVGDLVRNESLAGGRNRSGTLHWLVEDVKLKAGGRYRIAVKSSNFEEIMGLQTGVSFREDLVEVVSMDGGVLQLQEQNRLKAGRGKYTLSWNDTQGRTYGSDEVLFYIDLRAKGDVQLRDVLALDGIEIEKEAYTSTFKLRDIDLTYAGVSGNYALYQNVPNPFEGETRIGFRIPHAAEVDLNIYDVTGRLIKQVTGEYTGGYHDVRFRFDELPSAGVLFYQIRSGEYSEMKQMILIR